jgi:hypothetical protein
MRPIIAAAAAAALFAATPARATLTFPATGDAFSANGTPGTLGAGPYISSTASMWTAGSYITQTFTGTGLTSINSLSFSYSVYDSLLATATVGFLINGIQVDTSTFVQVIPRNVTSSDSVTFAPITGNGTYVLTLELLNTLPAQHGSISFNPGGTVTLANLPVPEPAAATLLAGSLLGVLLLRRRRQDPD